MKKYSALLCWSVVVSCLAWSLYSLGGLRTEYSVDQFYPKEHPLLAGHDKITHQFRLNQDSPYLFVIQHDEHEAWLNPVNIKALQNSPATSKSAEMLKQSCL